MGREVVYCDFCGERLLPKDLEKGRAVVLLKKKYCPKCLKEALEKGRSAGARDAAPPRGEGPPTAPQC